LISLKKYLEMQDQQAASDGPKLVVVEPVRPGQRSNEYSVALACYRSALLAMGKSALQVIPALGASLERELQSLEQSLVENHAPESVIATEQQVEELLAQWGAHTSNHLKGKADEVRELLVALARTAESVGSRDLRYKSKFSDLTVNLQRIGDLENLTQIRASLVERVQELRNSVEQMTAENQQLVSQLRTEVSSYETRLKQVERMVLSDDLTGTASRRNAEERIQKYIANRQIFCLLLVDLNKFKQINDKYGHLAGDEVLRQFSRKLQIHSQPGDLVSRWGGDEFVVVLPRNAHDARLQVKELCVAVGGNCTVQDGNGNPMEVHVDASYGLAQWRNGQSMEQLIAQADGLMYQHKHQR
jgi:diguanylate cyclase (GGDEF)-like protein